MKNTIVGFAILLMSVCASSFASAQDGDELRAKELQAKIKKQMSEIDELLLSAEKSSPKAAAEKMAEVKRNLEDLLKDAQTKQAEVVSDIEELVRMAKMKQSKKGGQGQSGSPPPQPQGGQKPPPERGRDPDVDELKKEGEQPAGESQEGDEPKDGDKPESGAPDSEKDRSDESTGSPPPDAKDKFEREDTTGRWGVLPGKVEELLKQLSTDQFPERYKKLIEQYYRRSQKADKK